MVTLTKQARTSDGKMSSSLPDHITKGGGGGGGGGLSSSMHGGRMMMKAGRDLAKPNLKRNASDSEVDDLALGGSSHINCRTLKLCKICAKKPLRLTARDLQAAALPHDIGDNGLIELIHSIRNQKLYNDNNNAGDGPSVELSQADDIVARAKEKEIEFAEQREWNIARHAPRDIKLYQENMDAMGKFEWDELKIGALLGVGGFSNVSEICGFTIKNTDIKGGSTSNNGSTALDGSLNSQPNPPPSYTRKEQVARKFLAKHAKRTTDPLLEQQATRAGDVNGSLRSSTGSTYSNRSINKSINSSKDSIRSVGSNSTATSGGSSTASKPSTTTVSYRYALKHLRPKLSEIYDKRTFNCAAVDLIGEAYFLLSLQHPNIIKLRGFATAGPAGYKQGNHNGYFLILDQLPETMEQRLVSWRKMVKKYKSIKRSLVSKVLMKKNRETASRKLDELLEERYHVAAEICNAMEYLHDRRMINRDLKIANIGFDIRGDVKLFDFGLSRWLPTSLLSGSKATKQALLDETFHMSSVGTKLYMAPEVILREPYSTKADVYSFGIVLWEMLCLSDPQPWNKEPMDAKEVKPFAEQACDNIPLCPSWPLPIQQVLKKCISLTPQKRPSFTDLRIMFRDELLVVLEDDEEGTTSACEAVRSSLISTKSTDSSFEISGTTGNGSDTAAKNNDNLKYASDDDLVVVTATDRRNSRRSRGRYSHSSTSDDECDDGMGGGGGDEQDHDGDNLGPLVGSSSGGGMAAPRRRSTHVLNFKDLSWLSSNSLKLGMDGSMKDNSLTENNNHNNHSRRINGAVGGGGSMSTLNSNSNKTQHEQQQPDEKRESSSTAGTSTSTVPTSL